MKKNPQHKRIVPKSIQDIEKWKLGRKEFLKTLLLGGLLTQIPIYKLNAEIPIDQQILSENQFTILASVQEILFPPDENGPSASEINATNYMQWVLSDKGKDPDEVKYILDGIGWVDETAEETYSKPYSQVSQKEKEELVSQIANEGWGESWLSVILSYIFEALLSDPKYSGNTDGIGWNWLNYIPGQPRPSNELLYPEILETVRRP